MEMRMNLVTKSITGLRWATLDYATKQVLQLVTTIILARFLLPADFGLIGMILVITGFVAIFKDLGTGAAIIQSKNISNRALSSIFWMNVGFGCIATLSLTVSASLIAKFYNDPAVAPLLRLMSVTFLISSLTVLHQSLLQRDLLFGRLAKINITSTFIGSLVGITAAVYGAGAMSLVYQTIVASLLSTILLWTSTIWHPQLTFDWSELSKIKNYSLNLTGYSIFNYFARNADYLLIGSMLGATALGYYTLAYQFMFYPVQIVSNVVSRVMFPAYAQIQNDDLRLKRAYLRMAVSISWVTFPVMVGLGAVSHSLISAVFGDRWRPAAPILVVLAFVGLIQSISTTVSTIYQAKGRTDWMFRWSIVSSILRTIAFAIGLRWGAVGVAIAYALSTVALSYHNFAIPFRLINLDVLALLRTVRLPFQYAVSMLGAILILQLLLASNGIDAPYWILIGSILVGMCTYGGLLLWKRPETFLDALSILPFRLPFGLSK
jgi:O-antigen/teichoic acid export membrane protein